MDEQEQMNMEQQENDEEINDEYRPATIGSETTAPNSETNADTDENIANGTANLGNGVNTSISGNGNGEASTSTSATAGSATASIPPNWNQSECTQRYAFIFNYMSKFQQ